MWKPIYTLGTLLSVGLLVWGLMLVFPEKGIALSDDFSLRFASGVVMDEDSVSTIGDVEEFLEVYDEKVDSVAVEDSLKAQEIARRQALMRIQFGAKDSVRLSKLFDRLAAKEAGEKIRILHYGDSQIEGDRISGFVRNALQTEAGGSGPGLIPAIQAIPTLAIKQSDSGNWSRYTRYGRKDSTITHSGYGLMMAFNRFTPALPDSLLKDSLVEAWFEYSPNRSTYSRNRKYTQAHLYFGNNQKPFTLTVTADGVEILKETIAATGNSGYRSIPLGGTPDVLRFTLSGTDSPDVYGVSLESGSGLYLDNLAMRGSSGTIFKRVDKGQLQSQYNSLDVELFILQFGGNTVPYIEDYNAARRYGKWFESQIRYLQSMVPNASVVVIGPSDMSTKVGTQYVTRPFLEDVRDALKLAAYRTGSGFWDIYEVMGGRNSMKSWVESDPPLAATDYTHFTPKGAKRMAELFVRALDLEKERHNAKSNSSAEMQQKAENPVKE